MEYLITVNYTSLWQRHVAWAKPKGQELKTYISSQYSTNMVLLSLLLGIQINIFFSSSPELIELRKTLLLPSSSSSSPSSTTTDDNQQQYHSWSWEHHFNIYYSLKFWIGFLLLLNICVTIMGILATFTTWSMISAISDRNAHCLIRSTIGQYVTTLPPRLVVASVYIFLLLFVLFIIDLVATSNPLLWILLCWVVHMFFSLTVRLSTFGRLILHTGAMSPERSILSQELEKELLPTGLYASLMIRAYHRRKQNTSVTNQYRRYQQQQQQQQHTAAMMVESMPTTATTSNNNIQQQQQQRRGGGANDDDDDDVTAFASDNDDNEQEGGMDGSSS